MADGRSGTAGGGRWRSPLFVGIYAIVLVGLLFSVLFLFSSFNSSNPLLSSGISSYLSSSSPTNLSSSSGSPSSGTPSAAASPAQSDRNENSTSGKDESIASEESKSRNEPETMFNKPIWKSPPNGKMPHHKEFRLTKKMVGQRVKDNVIVVTFGNYAFMDFIVNWVKHLTDLNVHNLLVGAMDTKLLEALYWKGIPVFDMESNMITNDPGWGSAAFHRMGREKVFLINALLPFGYELLMCDTDMVWLKNPLPYFARFPDADILTSTDVVAPTVTDDSLEVWDIASGAYNIGIFHWRPTDPAKKFAKEWKQMLLADDNMWDQNGFNDLVRKVFGPAVEGQEGLFYAYDGTLKLGLLPSSIFCSGHTYFVQAMYKQLRLEPYAVHTTFQFAGTPGKRHRLREGMLFYDQPSYYDSPGGFLSFKLSIPKSLMLEGAHTVESHFALVNHQIKQVRTALAIATLLGRTLVMPPLWCRLDRLWFGHPGVLEGTMTQQPFLCPMDHIFQIDMMLSSLSEAEFGPHIDFREYSFLDNPAVPREVKDSVLEVQLCEQNSPTCAANGTVGNVVHFPRNSTQKTLIDVFHRYKDTKILHFSSILHVFQGFSDKVAETKFRQRVKRYVGIWCCVMDRRIGHIYYDMYWDEKPGWKPHPPSNSSEDHPALD